MISQKDVIRHVFNLVSITKSAYICIVILKTIFYLKKN